MRRRQAFVRAADVRKEVLALEFSVDASLDELERNSINQGFVRRVALKPDAVA